MTIAYVTGTSTGLTTGASSVTTSGINTTTGQCIFVAVFAQSAAPNLTISDSLSNNWSSAKVYGSTGNCRSGSLYLYVLPNATGGTGQTFTASDSDGGSDLTINVLVFSGVTTGSVLDGTVQAGVDTSFVQSHPTGTVSLTTSTAGSVLIGIGITNNNASETFTAGSGYTLNANNELLGSGSTYVTQMVQYQVSVSAGAFTAPWTTSQFDEGNTVLLALLPNLSQLSAAVGTYAYTGEAVTFSLSSIIPDLLAASGTYNYVGAFASSDYQLIAAEGVYAYTGVAAVLSAASVFVLTAASGTYAYTGEAAALRDLPASVGIYSYNGLSAQLVAVISPVFLTAASGTYSIAAQTAQLAFAPLPPGFRVMAVSAGEYMGVYHTPGDVFDIISSNDFSDSSVSYAGPDANTVQYGWMRQVASSTPLFNFLESNNAPYLPPQDPSRRFIY
jgi:hypothetical protein